MHEAISHVRCIVESPTVLSVGGCLDPSANLCFFTSHTRSHPPGKQDVVPRTLGPILFACESIVFAHLRPPSALLPSAFRGNLSLPLNSIRTLSVLVSFISRRKQRRPQVLTPLPPALISFSLHVCCAEGSIRAHGTHSQGVSRR